ncbi:unnamed protein product [Urochloa humidicola]
MVQTSRGWRPSLADRGRVIFMESFLDAIVDPGGWVEWNRTHEQIPNTVVYLEYGNSGPGADTTRRVNTPAVRVASCSEAEKYTADLFINASEWVHDVAYPRGLQHRCP